VTVVPFVDLRRQATALAAEPETGFADVLDRGRASSAGRRSSASRPSSPRTAVSSTRSGSISGTDAIALALRAHGVGLGDEVATAANTCVAAIVAIEATPVLADVDPETWTLDPESAEAAITPRTKALVPVDLYGQCADLEPLRALASEHGLVVVEDASQAHNAEYRGSRCGSVTTATYSFYPTKNLGALGDAGAVVTNDAAVADELRRLRSHGERAEAQGITVVPGVNSRLGEIQAGLLTRRLTHLSVSDRLCERVVSLPLNAELTDAEAEQVADAVRAA
jgi:dTDP-4-amino-4,6-dideoxygalactose transaminase